VNRFGSDYLWHSKKDLVRNLLWVIALISKLCRKSSEICHRKNVNISQLKPIEMVMISTDGHAYVKLHRYLGQ
jgi:hypothetical protein